MPQKILTIIGTRPEGIKLAPLVLELQRRPQEFESVVCVTGQHREMLDQVLQAFSIKPDHDLNLMAPNQSLSQVTARATAGLDEVFSQTQPDVALVQGDTTTVLCGALVGHYHKVTVGHIEAGLRTGNKFSISRGNEPSTGGAVGRFAFSTDQACSTSAIGRGRRPRKCFCYW